MNSRWISFAVSFFDICRSYLTYLTYVLQVRRDRGAEGRVEKWARDGVENGRVVPGRNYRNYSQVGRHYPQIGRNHSKQSARHSD